MVPLILTLLLAQSGGVTAEEFRSLHDKLKAPVDEAWRIGLVNEIVPPADVLPRALSVAARISENGPLAVQAVKEAVRRSEGMPLPEALRIESEVGVRVFTSHDAIEGPLAFMERRKPVFTGR